MSDIARLRDDFPALQGTEGAPPPVYLDSACMSLVPQAVLDAIREYYTDYPGCAGRSLHRFAEEVGHRYEGARESFARFLGAPSPSGIVFLRNATEAINLVAHGFDWKPGDRVLVTDQEHNSNLVVWQRLAQERGLRLAHLRLPADGTFDADALDRELTQGVRLVSFFQTSNLDGRSLPVREIAERAHRKGAEVLIDGCQAAPHQSVDLRALGVDFYALSLHKMLGPSGTGLLAGAPERLAQLSPLIIGGETVEWTTLTEHQLRPPPHRFEAGLQNYAGVLGAAAGLRYLEQVGLDEVEAHDRSLNARATGALAGESRVRLLGPQDPALRPSIYSFTLDGVDPNDAALFLDEGYRVMVRSGMHCVHSWYRERSLPGSIRASFYLYTSPSDIDTFVTGIRELMDRIPASPTGARAKPTRGSSRPHRRTRPRSAPA
ncbi:MAG: cysteine desulfurase [Thermoplasmata archaeon]|nr:cysteine desulfurase [Thermoplasmata archaeon]